MSRSRLRVSFVDWWGGFPASANYFFNLLSLQYEVELSRDPDVVFFSAFGRDRATRNRMSKPSSGLRVYYTGENIRPDFDECDIAITFDRLDDPRHYRLPLWALADGPTARLHVQADGAHVDHLVRGDTFEPERNLRKKRQFCDFVYTNRGSGERTEFYDKLSAYRTVVAAGRIRCNTKGGLPKDGRSKLNLQRSCKFSITFENSSSPGYVTEKILHPFLAGSVPIYWGAPDVDQDFDPRSFINCHEYETFDEVVDLVQQIDQDDDLYLQYLRQPPLHGNVVPEFAQRSSVLHWLQAHIEGAVGG